MHKSSCWPKNSSKNEVEGYQDCLFGSKNKEAHGTSVIMKVEDVYQLKLMNSGPERSKFTCISFGSTCIATNSEHSGCD